MPDEYAREVLRDAIPLLEQLLERLKVIASAPRTVSIRISDLPDPLAPLPPDATDEQRANQIGLMHSLGRIWNVGRANAPQENECQS